MLLLFPDASPKEHEIAIECLYIVQFSNILYQECYASLMFFSILLSGVLCFKYSVSGVRMDLDIRILRTNLIF